MVRIRKRFASSLSLRQRLDPASADALRVCVTVPELPLCRLTAGHTEAQAEADRQPVQSADACGSVCDQAILNKRCTLASANRKRIFFARIMMAVQWFLRGKDKVHGPFDAAKLRAFATAGKISRNTDISQSAEGPWHKAGRVQGLFATAAIDGGVQPPAQSVPPPLQRDTGLSERRPIKSPPMSKVMPPSSSLPQNIQLNSIDPTELAFNATKKPLSQQKQKKTRGGKIGGGLVVLSASA